MDVGVKTFRRIEICATVSVDRSRTSDGDGRDEARQTEKVPSGW